MSKKALRKKNISFAALLLLCVGFISFGTVKQLKSKCKEIVVELETGTVNGLPLTAEMADVKTKLPCFSGDSPEGGTENCGGGVFYSKHDFFFYTNRNYIEIRENFKGKLKPSLLQLNEASVKAVLGEPAQRSGEASKNENWYYITNYGTIVIKFYNGNSSSVQLHAVEIEEIQPC